jgi:hypothetical protein
MLTLVFFTGVTRLLQFEGKKSVCFDFFGFAVVEALGTSGCFRFDAVAPSLLAAIVSTASQTSCRCALRVSAADYATQNGEW